MAQSDGEILIDTRINTAAAQRSLGNLQRDVGSFADRANASFDSIVSSSLNVNKALKTVAGSFAALKLASIAKDALLSAAHYQTLGVAMEVVGRNAGYTAQQMHAYEEQLVKAGIASTDARNAITKMAAANIDLSKSAELAKVAQNQAIIANENSSETFLTLVRAIETGNTVLLKSVGLNVSFADSYKDLGNNLSIVEKKQARYNAIMEAAATATGAYDAAMMTAGKQLSSLARYTSDLSSKIGEIGLGALAVGVSEYTDALKSANDQMDEFAASGAIEAIKSDLGGALKVIINNADVAAVGLGVFIASLKLSRTEAVQAASAYVNQTTALSQQNGLWATLRAQILAAKEALNANTAAAALAAEQAMLATLNNIEAIELEIAANKKLIASSIELKTSRKVGVDATRRIIALEAELVILRQQLKEQNTALAVAENAHATALGRTNIATILATKAAELFKSAWSGIVSIMGGPVIASITAISVASYALYGRMKESRAVAEGYRKSLTDVGDAAAEAAKKIVGFNLAAAGTAVREAEVSVEEYKKQVKELTADISLSYIESENFIRNWSKVSVEASNRATIALKDFQSGAANAAETLNTLTSIQKEFGESSFSKTLINAFTELLGIELKLTESTQKLTAQNENLNKVAKESTFTDQQKRAAEAAKELAEAIAYLDSAQQINTGTFKDSIKWLQDLVKGTKSAKEATEAQTQAKAHAVLMEIAFQSAIAAVSGQLEESIRLMGLWSTLRGQLVERTTEMVTKATKKGASDVANYIKNIQSEIDKLNGLDAGPFSERLAYTLNKISVEGKAAGLSIAQITDLQKKFEAAATGDALRRQVDLYREVNIEIANMTGNLAEATKLETEQRIEALAKRLGEVGIEGAEAALKIDEYRSALDQQVNIDNIRRVIDTLKDVKDAAPEVALEINKLNKELLQLELRDIEGLNIPDDLKEKIIAIKQQLIDTANTFEGGMTFAVQAFALEWTDSFELGTKAMQSTLDIFQSYASDVIDSIFSGSKVKFKDLINDMTKMILKMFANQQIAKFLSMAFSGFSSGGTTTPQASGDVPSTQSITPATQSLLLTPMAYSNDDVASSVSSAVQGVMTSQSSSGSGRSFSGYGGNTVVNIVNQSSSATTSATSSETSQGTDITVVIADVVASNIMSGGSVSRALQSKYPIKPKSYGT